MNKIAHEIGKFYVICLCYVMICLVYLISLTKNFKSDLWTKIIDITSFIYHCAANNLISWLIGLA